MDQESENPTDTPEAAKSSDASNSQTGLEITEVAVDLDKTPSTAEAPAPQPVANEEQEEANQSGSEKPTDTQDAGKSSKANEPKNEVAQQTEPRADNPTHTPDAAKSTADDSQATTESPKAEVDGGKAPSPVGNEKVVAQPAVEKEKEAPKKASEARAPEPAQPQAVQQAEPKSRTQSDNQQPAHVRHFGNKSPSSPADSSPVCTPLLKRLLLFGPTSEKGSLPCNAPIRPTPPLSYRHAGPSDPNTLTTQIFFFGVAVAPA